jgi:hypothetical protein
MSSMRFSVRLDTSHHGPPHLFKDAVVVADSLTGIHNAMVKCPSLSTGAAYIRVFFLVSSQVKIQRIQIWRGAWRPCSGSSCTYPAVITGVIENISHSTAKCVGTPSHMYHIHALTPAGTSASRFTRISVVVTCKSMWQNMRAYQTVTNNPCPHIDAKLLLVSTQHSFIYNS